MSDPWKREDYHKQNRIPQQTQLQLNKTVDATPEEFDEWYETELKWWADIQIPLVAVMAFIQLFVFGGMLMAFFLIGLGVK